jgi:hypothetical protein
LSATFGGASDQLQVLVTVELSDDRSDAEALLDQTGFAWMVLNALTDTVETEVIEGRLRVCLTKVRGARS